MNNLHIGIRGIGSKGQQCAQYIKNLSFISSDLGDENLDCLVLISALDENNVQQIANIFLNNTAHIMLIALSDSDDVLSHVLSHCAAIRLAVQSEAQYFDAIQYHMSVLLLDMLFGNFHRKRFGGLDFVEVKDLLQIGKVATASFVTQDEWSVTQIVDESIKLLRTAGISIESLKTVVANVLCTKQVDMQAFDEIAVALCNSFSASTEIKVFSTFSAIVDSCALFLLVA